MSDWVVKAHQRIGVRKELLRAIVLSGREFDEAARLVEAFEAWEKAQWLLERGRRPYEAPSLHWKLRAAPAEARHEWQDLHRKLWDHETDAARVGKLSCECDLCRAWQRRRGELEEAAHTKSKMRRRRKATSRAGP